MKAKPVVKTLDRVLQPLLELIHDVIFSHKRPRQMTNKYFVMIFLKKQKSFYCAVIVRASKYLVPHTMFTDLQHIRQDLLVIFNFS